MRDDVLQFYPEGGMLVETWGEHITAVQEALGHQLSLDRQVVLAACLENTQMQFKRVDHMYETTQPTDIGPFKKFALELVTAVVPNLIALDLFSAQPMTNKIGEIRYVKYLYGSNKGRTQAGTAISDAFNLGERDVNYSSEVIEGEYIGADGETHYTGNLSYIPVRPGTVKIDVGGTVISDNGSGQLAGTGVTAGTINYANGAYDLTFSGATAADLTADYEYRLDYAPVAVPQIDIKIETSPIIAKSRKLRALFAFDAAFDMQRDYGVDINTALVSQVATEIKHEIDGELLENALAAAGANGGVALTWAKTPGTGVSITEHNLSIWNKMVESSNAIFAATKRAAMTWVCIGIGVANIIETLPNFKSAGVINPVGPHLVGYLNNVPVYKNPYFPADEWLAGYRGTGLFDAGLVYAPYMPVMTTSMIMTDDFVGRRGFATAYGKKMVNSKLYAKGRVTA